MVFLFSFPSIVCSERLWRSEPWSPVYFRELSAAWEAAGVFSLCVSFLVLSGELCPEGAWPHHTSADEGWRVSPSVAWPPDPTAVGVHEVAFNRQGESASVSHRPLSPWAARGLASLLGFSAAATWPAPCRHQVPGQAASVCPSPL